MKFVEDDLDAMEVIEEIVKPDQAFAQKLNYKCPKGTVDPDSYSCGKTKEEAKKNYEKIQSEKRSSKNDSDTSKHTDDYISTKSILDYAPSRFSLDTIKSNPKTIEDAVRNVNIFNADAAHIDEQPDNIKKEYIRFVKGSGVYKEAREMAEVERFKFNTDDIKNKWEGTKGIKWKENETFIGRNDLYINEILNEKTKDIIYKTIDEYGNNENFPPVRGIVSRLKMFNSDGVSMTAYAAAGDGILILNEPMIMDALSSTKDSIINTFKNKFESNVKYLRENINKQEGADYDTQERIASAASFVNRNAETYTSVIRDRDEKLMPWNYSKDRRTFALKPICVLEYFEKPEDKLKAMIYHEMAHHIHQFYKEKSAISPDADKSRRNRFERLLNENYIGRFNPTVYSNTNGEEWFAENYALYKMNRFDLVDDLAKDVIKMIEKGEDIQ